MPDSEQKDVANTTGFWAVLNHDMVEISWPLAGPKSTHIPVTGLMLTARLTPEEAREWSRVLLEAAHEAEAAATKAK